LESKEKPPVVAGIDLAGVAHRPSGICLLRGVKAETLLLYGDQEIVDFLAFHAVSLAAVDAPLNLPPGRKSMADRTGVHCRSCDEELRRRRIPFFPITLGPMRGLTERGIALRQRLERQGIRVIEIYPGGAQDVWRIPRARKDMAGLRRGLARLGLKGLRREASDHELDAASGALVGLLFLRGQAEVLGDFSDGAIVMPRWK
jgi:hypothetical protein